LRIIEASKLKSQFPNQSKNFLLRQNRRRQAESIKAPMEKTAENGFKSAIFRGFAPAYPER